MATLKSFTPVERFLDELQTPRRQPGYVFVGDEAFLYQRCRQGVLALFVPPELRDFCLHDFDLADISIFDILDRAQTPSLMAPFQVIFIRGLKALYGRGQKKEEFAAIDFYFRHHNPNALLLFVADHLHIPTDRRLMEIQEKERFERIRDTLVPYCGLVELARVNDEDATRWLIHQGTRRGVQIEPDAARELVDALGANMLLISSEFEKLALYAQGKQNALAQTGLPPVSPLRSGAEATAATITDTIAAGDPQPLPLITRGDVETMVLAAKHRSLYDLTDAISRRNRPEALSLLHGLLNASDGGEDSAIGHLYMLARTFRQMIVILEHNIRDSRAIWGVLWQGFRMPPFAADNVIRQARRYKSRASLTRALRQIARADLELRSSPPDKRLVLERLILNLATDPAPAAHRPNHQFAMDL